MEFISVHLALTGIDLEYRGRGDACRSIIYTLCPRKLQQPCITCIDSVCRRTPGCAFNPSVPEQRRTAVTTRSAPSACCSVCEALQVLEAGVAGGHQQHRQHLVPVCPSSFKKPSWSSGAGCLLPETHIACVAALVHVSTHAPTYTAEVSLSFPLMLY